MVSPAGMTDGGGFDGAVPGKGWTGAAVGGLDTGMDDGGMGGGGFCAMTGFVGDGSVTRGKRSETFFCA
ncbi:MAG: hypothetical protein Q8O11_01875 [Syntrophales bacterium]|nr:hypothetical protein [Syntrophales bacterium]